MDLFWSEFIRFGSGDKFRIVDDDDSWIRDFEGQGRVTSINDNELVLDIVIPKQDIPTRGLLRNIVENRLGSSILPIPKIEAVLKIILIKEEGGNLLEVKGKYTKEDGSEAEFDYSDSNLAIAIKRERRKPSTIVLEASNQLTNNFPDLPEYLFWLRIKKDKDNVDANEFDIGDFPIPILPNEHIELLLIKQ